jgi:Fe-S cluster biogenesis protein NfuA/nitrite reductase/ring-hydroxylating ferredoxin subunit
MPSRVDDAEVRARVAHVEHLLEGIESLSDPVARTKAVDTVQALLELYGEGLARILDRMPETEARALVDDELVAHLLIVHGLHPVDLPTRVHAALDGVRPYLGSHGGDVELLAVEDGMARLRMSGSCDGCPSSLVTLKLAIEEAILKAAPEIEKVIAEGVDEADEARGPKLLQIESRMGASGFSGGRWTSAGPLEQLADRSPVVREVDGEPVLFLFLDGTPYAYARTCPACGAGLDDAGLEGNELACRGCGARFDVRRAGRPLDGSGLQLRPIPLLVDAGVIKVGLEGVA